MLSSIHPLGERARHNRWGLTVFAHFLGSWAGGVVVFTLAALAGTLLPDPVVAAFFFAGIAVVAELAAMAGRPIPGPRRQVNEDWLNRYRGWVYGFGFGFQLGAGLMTIVTTAAVYLALGITMATADVRAGVAVGTVFGLVRAMPLLVARGVDTAEQLRSLHARVRSLAAPLRVVNTTGVVLLSLALIAVVLQ